MTESDKAINTKQAFRAGVDISDRKEEILAEVAERSGFEPKEIVWTSDYFGSDRVGAFHCRGEFAGKAALAKIQGAKPRVAEEEMIAEFSRQNESQIIRSPEVYQVLPWDDKRDYTALIMEYVDGDKVLPSGRLQTREKIEEFFAIYREYRANCCNEAWLSLPEEDYYQESLELFKEIAGCIKANSPYRRESDLALADRVGEVLQDVWRETEREFMHGHFSCEDLIRQDDEIVLFSNLLWRWDYPFFDAVFAYHWFMYSLARAEDIQPEDVEKQRQIWLDQIYSLPRVKNSSQDRRLLNAALLERAIAGLLVDAFAYIDKEAPLAEYMVISTRKEVERLLDELTE